MKYKIALLGLMFLSMFLFFYNRVLGKNLNNIMENRLATEKLKNENLKKFTKNLYILKEIANKCKKYDYEFFLKFCSNLANKMFINDLCINHTEVNNTEYLCVLNNLFKELSIEISFSADREEFITKFIDILLSSKLFVYYVNECVISEKNWKYYAKIRMRLLTINLKKEVEDGKVIFIDKKDYPLKIIDRKMCYTGIIRTRACTMVYLDNNDILHCFPKNTKFSLTKYTDSFIICYVKKLKKNFKLFLGKEEYIHP